MRVYEITRGSESEIKQAANILHLAFREHWPDAWQTLEEALDEMEDLLASDRICLCASEEDEVIGLIGGMPSYGGRVWELHPLAVHPNKQLLGVGRRLIQEFESRVKAKGGLTIMLGSDDVDDMTSLANADLYDDLPSKLRDIKNYKRHPYEFYIKQGYSLIGALPDANGRGKPDILLAKRI